MEQWKYVPYYNDFSCDITVTNNKGGSQVLTFCTAIDATTGDGLDNEPVGQLDAKYCE